jgi:uncharacterized protein
MAAAPGGPVLEDVIATLPSPGIAAWLAAAALASGLARGFSGFGAALIFVPLASVVIGPRAAAPLMLLMEVLAVASLVGPAWSRTDRGEVGLLSVGLVLGTPLGAAILAFTAPQALRWGVPLLILALLGLQLSGWRPRGRPGRPATVAVGVAGGVLGGIATISGPPVMVYLLGQGLPAARIRATFNLYLVVGDAVAAVAYLVAGLLTMALAGPFLVAVPAYGLGIWVGSRLFGLASETSFRRACHAMIGLSALVSLPLWEGLLR